VDQRLQQHGRAYRTVAERALEANSRGPPAPPLDRVRQSPVQLGGFWSRGWTGIEQLGPDELDGEVNLVALPHRHAGSKVALGAELEVGFGEHQEAIVPPDGAEEALTVLADPRPDLGVVEPGTDHGVELHLAPHSLHHAQDLAVGRFGSALSHREAVEDAGLASPRPERGLQYQRSVRVPARRRVAAGGRRDRAVPALLPIQDPAE